jgi:hypothetical protein
VPSALEGGEGKTEMAHEQDTLTTAERVAEQVALSMALKGVRQCLAALPPRSPWVRCLREFRNGLGAQVEAPIEPERHVPLGRDDLAA